MTVQTISQTISAYLDSVQLARRPNTARTYGNALKVFQEVLKEYWLDPETTPIEKMTEDAIPWLATYLKNFSTATERLYLTAVAGFYKYVAAERLADINLSRLSLLIQQRARRPGVRLPQFPSDDLERVLDFVTTITEQVFEDENEKLRALRDKSYLLTLADTGLRVHEACGLRRGDIDWNEGRAIIIGKGDKQAVIRFSTRSMRALRDYLSGRSRRDGASNRPLTALPLFARHDKGAGKKLSPSRLQQAATSSPNASDRHWANKPSAPSPPTPSGITLSRPCCAPPATSSWRRNWPGTVTSRSHDRYAHLSDDELDRG